MNLNVIIVIYPNNPNLSQQSQLIPIFMFRRFLYYQFDYMHSSIGVFESREEERRKLKQMSSKDDLFDLFVRMVIGFAPIVYVFINITLIIWVAQTIFASSLSTVPNSLYLLTPLLSMGPIVNIVPIYPSQKCPVNTTVISIQTIPSIIYPQIAHKELTMWGTPGVEFCVERLSINQRYKKSCPANQTLCSGYCVKSRSRCPITNIKVIAATSAPIPNHRLFLTLNGQSYYYSRKENVPIITFMAAYVTKCANDQYYNQQFQSEIPYWNAVLNCGNEGTINSFYVDMTSMSTNAFLASNHISMTVTDPRLDTVYLGFAKEFQLSNSTKAGCSNSFTRLNNIQPFLRRRPVSPQFTSSLLIVAFILLVAQIIWLMVYYCFQGFSTEKNVFVVLISIIEAVIIGFIYSQNSTLFYLEKLSSTLAKCLKQSLPAVNAWNFGISSPQSFKMVIFINIVFLGLFIVIYLIDHFFFKELIKKDQFPSPAQNPRPNQNSLIAY